MKGLKCNLRTGLCVLGSFWKGVGSLKDLEQEERVPTQFRNIAILSDFFWRIQRLGLGQGVWQTARGLCGTSS